ncbi:MAG: glycosyl hydrolase, partial [Victivallaceae bacterium]|nr:glycosyl hydrolase [Victivallaceae bacterium]
MIRSKLYGLLESEAPEFRAAPFWAWNGELTEPELRRQIRDMHRMGFGGFFMHSRVGLRTPYLSKAWFDAIKVCVDEAEKNNMKAWLFDEDRWPSGTCGGEVTRDLRYALQGLDYKLSNRITPPAANSIGRYAAAMRNGEVFSCRLLNDRDELRPGEKFLHIFRVFDDTFDNDNNMAPMVDTMNPEAIRRFIELTHEKYAREVGDDFGSRIPGIFTDEPRYFIFCHSKSPWTTAFPEKFKEKYGYDLLPRLPELFFLIGGEAVSKLRLDFYNLASELFCNAFAKQVGEWCGKHHLALTGHALGEEDLLAQRDCIGSAMRFYEHQQQPGIDVLTEHWNAFDAPIQCSSVARQMGRKHCLSEMYAGLNWETRFEAIKAVAEWQAALGIDTRCPHLALYSMDGEAKRDFPPSFLSQAPWFKEYKMVEDHFARLHTVWSWGKSVRETLVIHPLESVFFYKPPCRMKKEKTVNRGGLFVYTGREKQNEQQRMIGVRNLLLSQHIAFDYGDEDMMSRMGSLCDGRLRVGEIAYRQVVIPKIRTIRASTLKLLNGFADNGGRVYYLGDAPEYVDGEKSGFARDSYKRFIPLDPRHVEVLNQKLPPPVSVCRVNGNREVGELLCDVHDGEGLTSLYMVNFSMSLPKRNHDQPAVSLRRKRFPRVEVKWR